MSIGVNLGVSTAPFDHQIMRDQNTVQNAQGTEFLAGTPFFPNFNQDTQEKMQNQVQGVGDFQNPVYGQTKGSYSRQSSDGAEGGFNNSQNYQQNNRLDYSAMAVFDGPLSVNKLEDNYSNKSWYDSNSDYQEQIEKFGYIFQSPDLGNQRQQVKAMNQNSIFGNPPFQNIAQTNYAGTSQYPQWEGYHHNNFVKQSQPFQHRASSFDKAASLQNTQLPFVQNEELETHSAASSGNHSAFSEGDVFQQNQVTPQQQYYMHQGYGGHYVNSNSAQYGFTPNIQFTNSNQKLHGVPFNSAFEHEDLTPGGHQNHGDIQITDLDVNLQKFQIGVSPRRMSNEFKPTSKLLTSNQMQGHLPYETLDKANSQNHQQYKTPSPYRNDPQLQAFNHNMMINQNINAQKNFRPQNQYQYPDPYYAQNHGFQNQRMSHTGAYGGKPNYPQQRSSNIDQYTGNQHIGMNAPPMTRNLQFPSQEAHIIHGGPMIAIQQNMHQAYQQNMHIQSMNMAQNFHPPLRTLAVNKQAGSQERDPSYQPLNFVTPQQTVTTKTVVNTPTHNNSLEHNKSVSSQNSNNSQQHQFTTAIADQNEAFLFQLTKQYDECQNPQQKLEIIKGQVHKLALTQKGSRFLQKQVTKANSGIVAYFLNEISPHLCDLMIDNYGNYFCQSLLSSCSGEQRLSILRAIQPKFIEICCDRKGTHTIQTMFELVNLPEEEDFIRDALMGNVIRLSKDPQGTHVVQKVMASFPEHKRAFIYEEVFDQFIELAKNNNGLCVVKKLVQFTKNTDQAVILMKRLQENAIDLVQDPFGNYAVTEIVVKWEPEVCRPIFEVLRSRISQLSSQKFSSNVIEKCLERADEQMRAGLIVELAYSDRLTSLIRNQYGNYVVQKALKLSLGQEKEILMASIQKCIPDITDKKIREKWEKIIYDAQHGTNTAAQSNVNDNTSTGSFQNQDHEVSNAPPQLSGGQSSSHRSVTTGGKRANSSDNSTAN